MSNFDAPLRFSTSILQRLGEELNPSPDQSILELVKNSYDANAVDCTIELIDTDRPGGTILLSDNGDGMDAQAIRDGWLVLGQSLKPSGQRTRLGRIRAGSKGLGRLAALRMGSAVTLISRPKKNPKLWFKLTIDWKDYDNVNIVEDVVLTIEEKREAEKQHPGTKIGIKGLKCSISRTDVKRLARSLLLLADPFAENPEGFRLTLKAAEFTDLENLVKNRYFNDAEYHLVANLDKTGRAHASVTDWRNKQLFSADHKELMAKGGSEHYLCPPAKFDLWVFILNSFTFSTRSSTLTEVREWLRTFGGVHLYENGLRVNPYGNPGNDWLDMNLSRTRSPDERPSTGTSIGRLSVFDAKELLVQKTDRSGFIESEAFLELKRFAKDCLDWMAKRRLELAEKKRAQARIKAPKMSERAKESLQQAIEKSPLTTRVALQGAFSKYEQAKQREIKNLRKEVQLYRTLSTAGITAATFAHESAGNPIKVINHCVNTVARRTKELFLEKYELIEEPLKLIKRSTGALSVLGNVTLDLIDHQKRRVGRVEVHSVIQETIKTFKPFLTNRNVEIVTELASANPFLRGSEAAIESVITNFLNNSLIWFEGKQSGKRNIVIRTMLSENVLTMRVFDNGPGIEGISKEDIWLPGQTTRPNGTGLGLTIVTDAVRDLGGKVEVIEHGELGGAEFIVELPIIGA